MGIHFLIAGLTGRELVLNVILMDCHTGVSQEMAEEDFLKAEGLDSTKSRADIVLNLMLNDAGSGDYAMVSLSRLLTDIGSEKLDICALVEDDFLLYTEQQMFLDLSECFSQKQLSVYGDSLLRDKNGSVRGIYTDALPKLAELDCYQEKDERAAIGIISSTKRKDMACRYLLYLTGKNEAR